MGLKIGKILAALVILTCFGLISVNEVKAQKVNKILNRIEKRLRATKTLNAKIEMRFYVSQLDEFDIFSGTIVFAASSSKSAFAARIDWTRPVQERLIIANGEYTVYRPHLNQAITGVFNKLKTRPTLQNLLFIFNQPVVKLKKNHTALIVKEKEKTKDGIKTTHLMFVPKTDAVYKSFEMWIDKKGTPVQLKVVEKNDDSRTIYLTEIKRNKKINTILFENKLPKTTKIIKG